MKIMLVRDRNVLNNNWLAYFANLLHERGHEVVIACDTYGKLGVSAPGHELEPGVLPCQCQWQNIFAAAEFLAPYPRKVRRRGTCLTV